MYWRSVFMFICLGGTCISCLLYLHASVAILEGMDADISIMEQCGQLNRREFFRREAIFLFVRMSGYCPRCDCCCSWSLWWSGDSTAPFLFPLEAEGHSIVPLFLLPCPYLYSLFACRKSLLKVYTVYFWMRFLAMSISSDDFLLIIQMSVPLVAGWWFPPINSHLQK